MKTGTWAIAAIVASAVVVLGSTTAQAQHHGRGHYDWHDTSHYDWHPGQLRFHRGHIDYVPGHFDFHSTGHLDYHRGRHTYAGRHRAGHYVGMRYGTSHHDRGHFRNGHNYGRYQRDNHHD